MEELFNVFEEDEDADDFEEEKKAVREQYVEISKKANPTINDMKIVTEKDLAAAIRDLEESMEQRLGKSVRKVGIV